MKAKPLFLALTVSVLGASAAYATVVEIFETGTNIYNLVLTNDGASFNLSGGNDALTIEPGTAGPNFAVPGIGSYSSGEWGLYPTDPDTSSAKSFQALFNAPAYSFSTGESYEFGFSTVSPATSFTISYLFELADGGSSEVVSGLEIPVSPSPVPEPASLGLLASLGVLLVAGSRRRRSVT